MHFFLFGNKNKVFSDRKAFSKSDGGKQSAFGPLYFST